MKIEIDVSPDLIISVAQDLRQNELAKRDDNYEFNEFKQETQVFLQKLLKTAAEVSQNQMNEAESITDAILEASKILEDETIQEEQNV